MRILTFTSLFPNSRHPGHGIFVMTRLQRLLQFAPDIEARVLAPVPWYPRWLPGPAHYRAQAAVPHRENPGGLEVRHPRFVVLPQIGMNLAPGSLARAGLAAARQLRRDGFDFDLIDAHYFYPDGVAAVTIAKKLGVPVTVTARGSDINLFPNFAGPRRRIATAAAQADRVFSVSNGLARRLCDLGVDDDKIIVARNGVDLELFHPPADRNRLRHELGVTATMLLSVGNLIDLKGHHLCIEALTLLPRCHLYIAGDGPRRKALQRLATERQVSDRVHWVGRLDQRQLADYYGAADALLLASSREGWANVLLEAMACGTPVVATNIPGNDEVVAHPAAGVLVARETAAIAAGVEQLLGHATDRSSTRAYAERFSWDETSALQAQVFRELTRQQ